MKWIIDTDPGVDDSAAIIMAVKLKKDIIGLSTVHGNVSLKQATSNALKIKELLDVDIPVYKGVDRPLLYERIDATEIHGKDGLGDIEWPDLNTKIAQDHGVDMIIAKSQEYSGNISILALGPLSNIALAIARDRSIINRISEIVIMGGTSKGQGNTSMVGEFNFLADPESAAIVLNSGINITLVPWETTADCFMAKEVYSTLNSKSKLASKFIEMTYPLAKMIEMLTGEEGIVLPDLVAAGVAFDRGLIISSQEVYASVETGGRYSRGLTAIDYWKTSGNESNVNLVTEVDSEGLTNMFISSLES